MTGDSKAGSPAIGAFIVPNLIAGATFLSGLVLLFSGSIPSELGRLNWLKDAIPLAFLEISHFSGSLIGLFLLILSWAIHRKINTAYYVVVVLTCLGILFSFFKGLHFEEALVLFLFLLIIVPSRRYFYRKAFLIDQRFSPLWFASVLAVFCGSLAVGFWSHRHIEYSDELWWRFGFDANAPRFLRAGMGGALFLVILSLVKIFRPMRLKSTQAGSSQTGEIFALVSASRNCEAYRALFGDKSFLISPSGKSFLMYRAASKTLVALGDPVGPLGEWKDLIFEFRKMADLYDVDPVFSEISSEYLYLYLDAGLTVIKLGERARVDLTAFSMEGGSRSEFRYIVRHMEKASLSFELVPREGVAAILPELKIISDKWLMKKNTREKGFSLGFFNEHYLQYCPHAVLRLNGGIVAFATLWIGAEKDEFAEDLVRYDPEASPKGAIDYLMIKLILWGKENGFRRLNLGMAPLAGMEDRLFSPLWNRFGSVLFQHTKHFYDFEGLRAYKEKFNPEWTSIYLAHPGGLSLPRAITDVAVLNSGGFKGIFSK